MNIVEKSVEIPINKIKRSIYHWRETPAVEDLDRLAESIKKDGQIHNVSLIRLPKPIKGAEYELINGHRRLMAAQKASIPSLRADIYELGEEEIEGDKKAEAIMKFLFAANLQEALQPLERAETYRKAVEQFGLEPEELASFFGRTQDEVNKDLKYLFIKPDVLKLIRENADKVTPQHIELLAEYSAVTKRGWALTHEQQKALMERVISGEDKLLQASPSAFKRQMDEIRKEARRSASARKARPTDEIKKTVVALERETRKLVALEVPAGMDFVEKSEVMSKLHIIAAELVRFAREQISKASEPVNSESE